MGTRTVLLSPEARCGSGESGRVTFLLAGAPGGEGEAAAVVEGRLACCEAAAAWLNVCVALSGLGYLEL